MNEQKAGLRDGAAEQTDTSSVAQNNEHESPAKGPQKDELRAQEAGIPASGHRIGKESEDTENSIEDMHLKIALLSEALESEKDKSLRAQAEVENIRRRASIEQLNTRKFAIESFATELLSVKDSLDLAEQVELSADNENVISKMQEGLSLTLKQLEHIFEKFSIKIVSPEIGDKLDPEVHQAMTIVPSDEVNPNCVIDVIQKGYQLHDRLLRPAMVVIAKKSEQKSSDSEQ